MSVLPAPTSAQRLVLPLIPAPSGGLGCRVPTEAMALAAIDKQGSRTFAIAYVQVQVKANVDGGILPRKTDDNSTLGAVLGSFSPAPVKPAKNDEGMAPRLLMGRGAAFANGAGKVQGPPDNAQPRAANVYPCPSCCDHKWEVRNFD